MGRLAGYVEKSSYNNKVARVVGVDPGNIVITQEFLRRINHRVGALDVGWVSVADCSEHISHDDNACLAVKRRLENNTDEPAMIPGDGVTTLGYPSIKRSPVFPEVS